MNKKIFEQFSSMDLLNFLFTKIKFLFKCQRYIHIVLEETLKRSRMVAILGREGMGKSSAIAEFIQHHPHTYYLRIGKSYAINNFFNEMLYQISGVYPTASETLFIKMKKLSNLLASDKKKKLIIIDDAGQLSPRALSVFFELRDNTVMGTGFVFIGLDYFQKKLIDAKNRGIPGISEFYRRVENWYRIPGINKNEIVQYGKECRLNEEQILDLVNGNNETIAEIENHVVAILEEAKLSVSEKRKPLKTASPGKAIPVQKVTKVKDDEQEDDQVYEEDEVNDKKLQAKRDSVAKARQIKKEKQKLSKVTSDA